MTDLDIRIERYRLTFTNERIWEVNWGKKWCIHRWLLVALWKAWRRNCTSTTGAAK